MLEVCFLVITDRGSMEELNISCAFSSRGQFMLLSSPHPRVLPSPWCIPTTDKITGLLAVVPEIRARDGTPLAFFSAFQPQTTLIPKASVF